MNTILELDLSSGGAPKYQRLGAAIKTAIREGTLAADERLPPVRELAWQLRVTPGTVARAYARLTDEGVLRGEVGRGTFVNPPANSVPDDIWASKRRSNQPGIVSLFSPQLPDVGQVAALRTALGQVAVEDPEVLLAYPTREGARPAREAVLHWLRDAPIGPRGQEDVVLTHGGQHAIVLVMQAALTGPRPTVLVEDLSYAGFRRAAELLRVEVVSIPSDEQGPIPAAVAAAARKHNAQLFCCSPEVQNPTGLFTPLSRRKALVEVARQTGLQLLEDDCYRMGRAKAPALRALAPDFAWYVTSLSKTLTPSLRVGFAFAPRGRSADLRRAAEYGHFGLARPLQEVLAKILIDPAVEGYAGAIRDTFNRYVKIAINVLGGYDVIWQPDVPFLWLNLPSGWRAAAFTRAAEAAGVQVRSADEFALRDGRAPHAVRIAIDARVPEDRFEEAVTTLRDLLARPPEMIAV